MGRILAEFLGTFLIATALLLAPSRLAVAAVLAASLWLLAAAPTGAFNPAVTVALLLRRRLAWTWAAGLVLAQLAAAVAAALVTALFVGHNPERLAAEAPGPVPERWFAALSSEFIATALLCLFLLAALTARRHAGSTLAPLMAGLGAFALLEIFGSWSTFLNPAVLLAWGLHDWFSALRAPEVAPALLGESARLGRFLPWAFLVGMVQLGGAVAGWLLFLAVHPEDRGRG